MGIRLRISPRGKIHSHSLKKGERKKIYGAGRTSEEKYFGTWNVRVEEATRPLGRCATCKESILYKKIINLFYHKLDAEYFLFYNFFEKSGIF